MAVAIVAALFAAAFFAVSSALQHRSATDIPKVGSWRGRDLARFAGHTVRHVGWLVGTLADLIGLALHAVALNQGPLTLVQPLLVTGVVFALPLRQWIDHRHPSVRELTWAAALSVGLATFLVIATPVSTTNAAADRVPSEVAVVAVTLGIAGFTWLGRRAAGNGAARWLGLATGVTFAASAALIKTTTDTLTRHPLGVFTSWPLYGLIVVGGLGLLLNQMAFQAGPLRISLPAMTASDPLLSLVIGVAVFDEHLRTGVVAVAAEVLSLGVVVLATVALSRSQATPMPTGSAEELEPGTPTEPAVDQRRSHPTVPGDEHQVVARHRGR
jgi:hypothetical protein